MQVRITPCRDEHLADLRRFFASLYGPRYVLAGEEALLRWQFGGVEPAAGRYHLKLGWVDGVIAACLGYIPVDISIRAQRLRGAWTANWIADPVSQRAGVGLRVMSELMREFDATLVAGASAQARQILPRLGFEYVGDLHRYVRVIDPVGTATLTRSEPAAWPAGLPLAPCVGPSVECVTQFDPAIDGLWDSLWVAGAGTRRTAAFLNWRYAAHPRFAYRLFVAGSAARPSGFAVYRIELSKPFDVAVGRMVEFVAESLAADALLGTVVRDAQSSGVAVLDYFCSSRRDAPALGRSGWLDQAALPATMPVLLQPVSMARRGIPFLAHIRHRDLAVDADSWYVTKGDGDQDRPN